MADFLPQPIDAMLWKAQQLYPGNDASQMQRSTALAAIAKSISYVQDAYASANYIKVISQNLRVKQQDVKAFIAKSIQENKEDEDKKDADDNGLVDGFSQTIRNYKLDDEQANCLRTWFFFKRADEEKKTQFGYYFLATGNWSVRHISNFVITPLYHIRVKGKERRMVSIHNGYEEKIIELDINHTSSSDAFRKEVQRVGGFWWKGSTEQLLTIFQAMGHGSFPACFEVSTLGWHPKGFFAFSNAAYNGEIIEYNNYGMLQHENTFYNIPFLNQTDQDYEHNDDSFESQYYLTYVKSKIDFNEWIRLMCGAYLHMGPLAIAFAACTLYRDIVLKSARIPLLYNYGAVNAGKSDFSASIVNLFFSGRGPDGEMYPAFNLGTQSTGYAFYARMSRFRNTPNVLNEFNENTNEKEVIDTVKGAFDGEGREKGDMLRSGKTTTQRIYCTVILNGQTLGSKDQNSIVSRSVLNRFRYIAAGDRPAAQVEAFTYLKTQEEKGLSSLVTDLLAHRSLWAKGFGAEFGLAQEYIFTNVVKNGVKPQVRVLKNWSCMLAAYIMLDKKYAMPIDKDQFAAYCIGQVIEATNIMGKTNTLAGFWTIFQQMVEQHRITAQHHWDLVRSAQVKIEGEEFPREFPNGKLLLFIRLRHIFPYYSETAKRIGSNDIFSLGNLESNMEEADYFIGKMSGRRFNKLGTNAGTFVTSCLVIDYEHPSIQNIGLALDETKSAQTSADLEGGDDFQTRSDNPF